MQVRYIYSACIEIEANDLRILTDPWFTEGIYDGSWYQFPRIDNPLDVIREPDVIYISHIHPDHYDPVFLRKLFDKWGEKPILIPDFENNYLAKKAAFDGLTVTPTNQTTINGVDIHIIPNVWGSASDIDSALFVHHGGHTVLNLNDCLHNPAHVQQLQDVIKRYTEELDLLALGYTGAGTYPQTYFDIDKDRDELNERAERKKQQFFEGYKNYCSLLPARHHLPFAGKYVLGGKLAQLNPYRGVADAVEVTAFDPKAVILADAGEGVIDLITDHVSSTRSDLYNQEDYLSVIDKIKHQKLSYELDFNLPFKSVNFQRLLRPAYKNARRKSEVFEDYYYYIHVTESDEIKESYLFNCHKDEFQKLDGNDCTAEPRTELFIDYRHLFGLLTGVYHWNNSEVGSQIQARRTPTDAHNYMARAFLNFMSAV